MILIVNAGSSSIKFKLFDIHDINNPSAKLEGIAERIGIDGKIKINFNQQKTETNQTLSNHKNAVEAILKQFKILKVIKNENEIKAIGFRIVHGGVNISQPCEINEEIKAIIADNVKLAPLHNPGALMAIEAFEKVLSNAKLVACFDTAFHQSIPINNFLYATPYLWYEKYRVRKYGFHGISYEFISQRMAKILNKDLKNLNLIICHLGNGASICAVKSGKSFNTSMGLTPLAGLIMGTRCGDIDPSIIEYMAKQLNQDVFSLTKILNQESGLLGMSEVSSDMRDVISAANNKNTKAQLALECYYQQIADYIIKYANQLEGSFDAIIFTAGIGENDPLTRIKVCEKLPILNLKIDNKNNEQSHNDYLKISSSTSKYSIFKVSTNEELMICNQCLKFLPK
ncbi:acetate kinase [Spiroplasma endosymbiont of Crioceris asparagi]|uniref:acetate kinase n=1 Tax=Spiroplasma endosymbiont of Crioceris asparagi TaxID=3066286 RepID=UPI0030D1B1E7